MDEPTALYHPISPRRRRTIPPERLLIGAVALLAMLVVGGAGALAVALTKGSGPSQLAGPNTPSNSTHRTHARDHAVAPPTAPPTSTSTTTSAPTTTTTVPVVVTGTGPVITGLSPSTGSTGQTIQVSGGNFRSANGSIVATFGGTAAGTNCPSSSTCIVTVPSGAPSGVVPLTITTAGGVSNTVPFNLG